MAMSSGCFRTDERRCSSRELERGPHLDAALEASRDRAGAGVKGAPAVGSAKSSPHELPELRAATTPAARPPPGADPAPVSLAPLVKKVDKIAQARVDDRSTPWFDHGIEDETCVVERGSRRHRHRGTVARSIVCATCSPSCPSENASASGSPTGGRSTRRATKATDGGECGS